MRNDLPRWHLPRKMRRIPPTTDLLARSLEEDSAWLHHLARALSKDPLAAEDAAQTALLAAWRQPASEPPRGRAWLAAVLRNALRQDARGEHRRRRREVERERERPGDGADPGPGATVARLELQGRVLAAVRGLEEPYRTTLVLRYLDGLGARAVAQRLGVPTKTVYTRLERGLAQLRRQLDQLHGDDRQAWTHALAALPPASWTWTLTSTGAGAMGLMGKWVAGAAAAAVITTVLVQTQGEGRSEPAGPPTVVHAEESLAADSGVRLPPQPATQRQVAPVGPAPEALPAATSGPPAARTLVGRVENTAGVPLPGLRVGLADACGSAARAGSVAHTDGAGNFELPWDERPGNLVVCEPGWVEFLSPRVSTAERAVRLVLAPAVELAGIVVDGEGHPLPDVELRADFSFEFQLRAGQGNPFDESPPRTTHSDEAGRFRLARVPASPEARLSARCSGHATGFWPIPERDDPQLELTLHRLVRQPHQVEGQVFDAEGRAVADAWVSTRDSSARSDRKGRFLIDLPEAGESPPTPEELASGGVLLRAVAAGHLPARRLLDPAESPQPFVELRLGGAPLTIGGKVVDAAGRPVPGAQVWALGLEDFGELPLDYGGMTFQIRRRVEELMSPDGGTLVKTDDEGRFLLAGLREAAYRVRAISMRTLALSAEFEVSGGDGDVLLRLESGPEPVRIAGRVEDRYGDPVAGVSITAIRHADIEGARPAWPSVRSAVDGSFAFEPLSPEDLTLTVAPPDSHRSEWHSLDQLGDPGALLFLVGRPARFRLTVTDPLYAEADLRVETAQGKNDSMQLVVAGVAMVSEGMTLSEGESGVLQVSDGPITLVLQADHQPELRIPVELRGTEIQEIHYP